MSEISANTLSTLVPGVDVLNIVAAGITFNGGSLPGGGGGSAYPDPVAIHTTASEVINLTSADQGWHFALNSGIVFNLPATASDGVTFKLSGVAATTTINVGGSAIFYPTINTVIKSTVGRQLIITALNVAIPSPTLVWYVVNLNGDKTWDSTVTYTAGEVVTYSGQQYIGKKNLNTNNTPSSSASWWCPLTTIVESTNSVGYSDWNDVTVLGGTPPTPTPGSDTWDVSYLLTGTYSKKLLIRGSCITPGSGNTSLYVQLTNARGVDSNIPTGTAGVFYAGVAEVNGGIPQLCIYDASSDRVVIYLSSAVAVQSFRAIVDILF